MTKLLLCSLAGALIGSKKNNQWLKNEYRNCTFKKYLLNTYYVPGTVLRTGYTSAKKWQSLFWCSLYSNGGNTNK